MCSNNESSNAIQLYLLTQHSYLLKSARATKDQCIPSLAKEQNPRSPRRKIVICCFNHFSTILNKKKVYDLNNSKSKKKDSKECQLEGRRVCWHLFLKACLQGGLFQITQRQNQRLPPQQAEPPKERLKGARWDLSVQVDHMWPFTTRYCHGDSKLCLDVVKSKCHSGKSSCLRETSAHHHSWA